MERTQLPGSDIFGLSQDLWKTLLTDQIFAYRDRQAGWGIFDDFKSFGQTAAVASNLGRYASEGNVYRTYEFGATSAATIAAGSKNYTVPTGGILSPNGQNTQYGAGLVLPTPGAITLTGTAYADSQVSIQAGPVSATANIVPFNVLPLSSTNTPQDLVFEARFQISSIATTLANFFIGLAGSGAAVSAVPFASNTAFATSKSLLGFGFLSGDTAAQLSLYYERNAGTVGSKVITGTTLAATTYIKAGFRWSGQAQTLTPYINGVAQDGVSGPNLILNKTVTGAAPWPDDYMTLCAGLFQKDTSTALTATIDWWAVAQSAN